MHSSEEKMILRQEIKKRIDDMDTEHRRAEGRTLSRVLLERIPKGSTICAYFPLKSEVDIQLLLKELLDRGDTVFLPVFAGKDKKMIYRRAQNLHDLPPGEFTIPEPPESAQELGSEEVDIILVPGRAFDRNGRRLGRGSGGYDTWLEWYKKHHPDTPLWGTCLQCQLVMNVPVELHDVPMSTVITAQEVIELA
ncbi:MAG: 5-formyltetrahydrofolate cyclo-ligase [Candidatus Peribacter sp.]|jgi:5-formyltetrahydrofolate cyclo-ligase|nr:5-formyltetrahydrofolate cyclo-ligase [Candidatus Peribacter sp.]MBT4392645.1 5-formyltetrahydrofolate cyclo-ligase [Candidatus Peribacter sp.]MBT4600738.1 5-formyltetrahydrofolate cyclo-ligase [Candidatus Peribacter sp.]MBT5148593.1 5-formyltetrahydrofolate cyclo-ligase [Candidatus Peribacter sp.]MBT5637811.1 5-formyltetrahydrofolate cyclo-ligase [Candidatus Peribacter sp.]